MTSLSLDCSRPGALPECYALETHSIKEICKGNQVMVYGLAACKYQDVFLILDRIKLRKRPPFRRVYNCTISNGKGDPSQHWTLEGRNMRCIDYAKSDRLPQEISRPCKTALTSLILENYKRIEEGRSVIPLVFCIDIDGGTQLPTMKDIADSSNHGITMKELRRAYKLCTHENPKIRRAAEETLKFVKLKYVGKNTYGMKQIDAPWANKTEAAELWKARTSASRSRPKDKSVNWRSQLEAHVAEYDKDRARIAPPLILPPALVTALPSALVSLSMKIAKDAYDTYKS